MEVVMRPIMDLGLALVATTVLEVTMALDLVIAAAAGASLASARAAKAAKAARVARAARAARAGASSASVTMAVVVDQAVGGGRYFPCYCGTVTTPTDNFCYGPQRERKLGLISHVWCSNVAIHGLYAFKKMFFYPHSTS